MLPAADSLIASTAWPAISRILPARIASRTSFHAVPRPDKQAGQGVSVAAADNSRPGTLPAACAKPRNDVSRFRLAVQHDRQQVHRPARQHQDCAAPAIEASHQRIYRAVAGEHDHFANAGGVQFGGSWQGLVGKADDPRRRSTIRLERGAQSVESLIGVAAARAVRHQPIGSFGCLHAGVKDRYVIRFPWPQSNPPAQDQPGGGAVEQAVEQIAPEPADSAC